MLDEYFMEYLKTHIVPADAEQIRADVQVSGTPANIVERAARVGSRAEEAAKKFGLVGVGVISFREARLAKFRRLLERRGVL